MGLEPDYKTFGKRPDRDGYQQFLVWLVANALGKNVVTDLSISFHPLQAEEICAIRASAATAPVYWEDGGHKKLISSVGEHSQELSGPQAVEYARARWPKNR